MIYDSTQLDTELRAAGLRIHGCASTGRIDWIDPPSAQDLATADAVKQAHDPNKRKSDADNEDTERRGVLANLATAWQTWDSLGDAARWASVRLLIRVVLLIARRLLQ